MRNFELQNQLKNQLLLLKVRFVVRQSVKLGMYNHGLLRTIFPFLGDRTKSLNVESEGITEWQYYTFLIFCLSLL